MAHHRQAINRRGCLTMSHTGLRAMPPKDVVSRIRAELTAVSDVAVRTSSERFFKEAVQLHGVRTTAVTAIARKYLEEVRPYGKEAVFSLCEALWHSGYLEESFIACNWAYDFRDDFMPGDFEVFERWISSYITNWASCDTLCNHSVGAFIEMHPSFVGRLESWAASANRWMRRASAVTLIIPARHGKFLSNALTIADILLQDEDDLVRKGYGWLLKAASEVHQLAIFDFVMSRREEMPRTALRYAIEKMPAELKARAMSKQG